MSDIRSGRNEQSLERTFNRCFLVSFGSFGQAVSEKKIFKNWPIRNKNCLWRPCCLTNRDEKSNLHRGPSIDASYQVSVHLVKWFQRRRFIRNQPIRNKNCLWRPCLLMDGDEMSNLYRGTSIDASYQVSFHLAKQFRRRRFFKNQPIRNKNCLCQPCLLTDRDEMSNLYRVPSIEASYQVSVHLAEGFQRTRLKCEKLTDDGRQVMAELTLPLARWAKKNALITTSFQINRR